MRNKDASKMLPRNLRRRKKCIEAARLEASQAQKTIEDAALEALHTQEMHPPCVAAKNDLQTIRHPDP